MRDRFDAGALAKSKDRIIERGSAQQ
jgi:hypothetical protein